LWVSPSLIETGAADAVLAALGAPAAAERPEIGDEEFRCARIDAMQMRHHEVGVMAGDDAVRDRLPTAP
jgi:hypothetical protein